MTESKPEKSHADQADYARFCAHYGLAEDAPESLAEYREYVENRAILTELAEFPAYKNASHER